MTPQTIITTARYILNDTGINTSTPRQLDAELLRYVNDGIKEASMLRPDLFTATKSLDCVAGQVEQTLTFDDAHMLMDVLNIVGGAALTPMDRMTLELFRPGWRADAAGPAQQWAPLEGDPLRFFIYPKAPAAQSLTVKYARTPVANYALGDTITDLPGAYEPALVDYVVHRAESKDDENVTAGRAIAHYAAFKSKFGVSNGPAVQK